MAAAYCLVRGKFTNDGVINDLKALTYGFATNLRIRGNNPSNRLILRELWMKNIGGS